MSDTGREYSSFRDPSGYVYEENGRLYRRITNRYFSQYDRLMQSGLYHALCNEGMIIRHQEIESTDKYITIQPERIAFISYPYEWCFGELKDAALLTLRLHRLAMQYGMVMKDATAYNIQFAHGNPVLIDTLSFGFYHEGDPWGAYGQFCRHFLAPLLLMCEKDIRMNRMLCLYIDGIPIDLAANLLGNKGGMLARQHIRWHANSITKHNKDGREKIGQGSIRLSQKQHLAVVDSLLRGIEGLKLKTAQTEWSDYYAHTNYSKEAAQAKERTVSEYLDRISPNTVWDIGANDGRYSRIALQKKASVVSFDMDPIATEQSYHYVKEHRADMLPLVYDVTNPSPGIGFANRERVQIEMRQEPDCVIALAVIHHIAISNNIPLEMFAEWASSLSRYLIIEFVSKDDSQVRLLLATREDIFPDYTESGFEAAFARFYFIHEKNKIVGSSRILYLMERKTEP